MGAETSIRGRIKVGLPKFMGGPGIWHRAETIGAPEPQEGPVPNLSAAALLADNNSQEGQRSIRRHEAFKDSGPRILTIICSDGRNVIAKTVSGDEIDTVGGVTPGWIEEYVAQEKPDLIVSVKHEPCGAHVEKGKQEQENRRLRLFRRRTGEPPARSSKYVAETVPASDPYETARIDSERLRERFPHIAQLTLVQHPAEITSTVVATYLPETREDLESYIRYITGELRPDTRISAFYDAVVRQGGYFEAQQVNNPYAVVVTNQLQGVRWQGVDNLSRFPRTLGLRPGIAFITNYPSESMVGVDAQGRHVEKVADEIHYAFAHTVASNGDRTKPFGRVDHLIIEGDSWAEIESVFASLYREDTMVKPWAGLSGKEIKFLLSEKGRVRETRTLSASDLAHFDHTGALPPAQETASIDN